MNKIMNILLVVGTTIVISAKTLDFIIENKHAEVNKKQGLYVYVESNPIKNYEVLGSASTGLNVSYQYVIDGFVNNAKRKYPNADGVIIYSNSKADVIKFK